MEKLIDCRGMACPAPVITTKKELDNINEGIITTMVDNQVAKENLSKLARSLNLDFKVNQIKDDEFHIEILKGKADGTSVENRPKTRDISMEKVIAIGSDKMGKGDDELGKILMKSFIYTVKETVPYPSSILFFNSGVYLTCEASEVLDDISFLESEGVDIQSCGTCLDFYELKDKLSVGEISNMYDIYEKMNGANIINIG